MAANLGKFGSFMGMTFRKKSISARNCHTTY